MAARTVQAIYNHDIYPSLSLALSVPLVSTPLEKIEKLLVSSRLNCLARSQQTPSPPSKLRQPTTRSLGVEIGPQPKVRGRNTTRAETCQLDLFSFLELCEPVEFRPLRYGDQQNLAQEVPDANFPWSSLVSKSVVLHPDNFLSTPCLPACLPALCLLGLFG